MTYVKYVFYLGKYADMCHVWLLLIILFKLNEINFKPA